MVKDPLDGGRTMEIPFPEPVPEVKFDVSEAVKKAAAELLNDIHKRSFSERHPELGKMINCQVCGLRHRQNERKCEQRFTHTVNDYEVFREMEDGKLTPDLRTATPEGERPTLKQLIGRAAFAKKRRFPHPSKIKMLFVQRVRDIFVELELPFENEDKAVFEKNLKRVRFLAAQRISQERNISFKELRRRGLPIELKPRKQEKTNEQDKQNG